MPHARITASEPQPTTHARAATTPRTALPPSTGSEVADQPVTTIAPRATSRARICRGRIRSLSSKNAKKVPTAG